MVLDSYFNLFLMMGGVFALLLSFYLMFYPSNFYANKVLGVLTLSWSITVFGFLIQSPDFFQNYPHLYASIDVFALLFYPLMYIYIRTYLYKDARSLKKYIIHLLPGLLYLILFAPFFIKSASDKAQMLATGNKPWWFDTFQLLFNLLIIVQGIFYSIISLRKLHHFQYFRRSRMTQSQISSINWLRLFLFINVGLWVIGTMGAVLDALRVVIGVDLFALFYLGLTILTIILGVFTIRRPEFFSEEEDIVKYSYSRLKSGSKSTELQPTVNDYELLMNYIRDEKPYLKSDLKMQDLVKATGLSYKQISELFNNELQKSFYEVINDFRMKMAFQLIQDGFHKKHTLPHLAEEAGFNSKTTFNRIFKKYTGQTPTEYIQSNNL